MEEIIRKDQRYLTWISSKENFVLTWKFWWFTWKERNQKNTRIWLPINRGSSTEIEIILDGVKL